MTLGNRIINGNFSNGWTNVLADHNLVNQQPNGWELSWLGIGDNLYDSSDKARGIPECVHKLLHQLPPSEQPGGSDALILSNHTTYKLFHGGASFGATLSQAVSNLTPGATVTIIVPIRLHNHATTMTDPYAAEARVLVNGGGEWLDGRILKNRQWHYHEVEAVVPDDGRIELVIQFKSKWDTPIDFFIDNVQLAVEQPSTPPPPDDGHTAIVVKASQEGGEGEWLEICKAAYPFRHTVTASHDDMLTLLRGGNPDSYVKVAYPHLPSQRGAIELVEAAGYRWETFEMGSGSGNGGGG